MVKLCVRLVRQGTVETKAPEASYDSNLFRLLQKKKDYLIQIDKREINGHQSGLPNLKLRDQSKGEFFSIIRLKCFDLYCL